MLFYSHGGAESEGDVLISMVAENTRIFGDLTLKALKEGETLEAITRRIGENINARYRLKANETDLTTIVGGYVIYFKSKGLA